MDPDSQRGADEEAVSSHNQSSVGNQAAAEPVRDQQPPIAMNPQFMQQMVELLRQIAGVAPPPVVS